MGRDSLLLIRPFQLRTVHLDGVQEAVYIHHVRRTQLYLSEDLYRRLRDAAGQQGRTVSDLVREAVARAYGAPEAEARINTLEGIASLWQGRRDLEATGAYVRRLRQDTRRTRKPE